MTKLSTLIDARQEHYKKTTEQIMEKMVPIFEGISDFVRVVHIMHDYEIFDPVAVSGEHKEEFGYYIVVGFLRPNIGSTVTLSSGEDYKITDESERAYLSRPIRLGLIEEVISLNSREETLKFLEDANAKGQVNDESDFYQTMGGDESNESDTSFVFADDEMPDTEKKDYFSKLLENAKNKSGSVN